MKWSFVNIPLSFLFRIGVSIRHWLYDKHLLPSFAVPVPTICVGNLAVGGTGKTPMTAYIVQLLLDHGYKPAVLSRGYKRKTCGFLMADAQSTVQTIGDEALQMHRTFPNIPIAVCEHRVRGIHQLQRQVPDLDVVILDDALQHRTLRCGFTVLLTPYDRLYIDDHMLPWGRLRDIPSRALKADSIVVTKCPESMRPIDMRVIDNRLLTGIAHPEYLLAHVQQIRPQAQLLAFPDHHAFTSKDIELILDRAKPYDWVLTTEKDMQRLEATELGSLLAAQGKALLALPIRTRFRSPHELFDQQILRYVCHS